MSSTKLRADAAAWQPPVGGWGASEMPPMAELPPASSPNAPEGTGEPTEIRDATGAGENGTESVPGSSVTGTPAQGPQQEGNEEWEDDPHAYGADDWANPGYGGGWQDAQYDGYDGYGNNQNQRGPSAMSIGPDGLPTLNMALMGGPSGPFRGGVLDEITSLPKEMFEVIPMEHINTIQMKQIEDQLRDESDKGIMYDPEARQVIKKDVHLTGESARTDIHRNPVRLTADALPSLPSSTPNDIQNNIPAAPPAANAAPPVARSGYAAAVTGGERKPLRDRSPVRDPAIVAAAAPQASAPAQDDDHHESASVAPSRATARTTATSSAPLTVNGNNRYKKENTKAKKRLADAQRAASDAFTFALVQSVSPFMGPLKKRCGTSLPHIKLDQRFGKRGVPSSAVAEFIVAPMVANYKPRHFHEVSPGDLMEFGYDFSLILEHIDTATAYSINYGPEWKQFALPYGFLSCSDYRGEVKKLCPDEQPNTKGLAVYDNDVLKDISAVLFSIEELEPLSRMSFAKAMRKRINLQPLYDVVDSMFAVVGNYQIQIRDMHEVPSRYIIKTSADELDKQISKHGPVVIGNDEELWGMLPNVDNTFTTKPKQSLSAPSQPKSTDEPQTDSSVAPPVATAVAPANKGDTATEDKATEGDDGVMMALVVSGACVAVTAGLLVYLLRGQKR